MNFVRREIALGILFVLGIGFYYLPITGIAFNSSELTLGLPTSVLAIFFASVFLLALILVFSSIHFLPWARKEDSKEGGSK